MRFLWTCKFHLILWKFRDISNNINNIPG
jgi:hypothetical protein